MRTHFYIHLAVRIYFAPRGCRQTSYGEDRKKQLLQSALGLYPRSFVHQAILPHRSNTARHGSGSFRPISSCLTGLICKCRCDLLSKFSCRLPVLQSHSPVTPRARRHQTSLSWDDLPAGQVGDGKDTMLMTRTVGFDTTHCSSLYMRPHTRQSRVARARRNGVPFTEFHGFHIWRWG